MVSGLNIKKIITIIIITISFSQDYENSFLPLIIIDTFGEEIPDEPRIPAYMGIIDNEGINNYNDDFNGYDGMITIELRGASSQYNPKKPYRFETVNEIGDNNNISLLGMPEENDWVLYAPWQDKTMIRNVLTYYLSNQMGRYASRTRFCELFINEDYKGVYVLMEKIKRDINRIDIEKLDEDEIEGDDLTGGYILKFDWGWSGDNNGGFYSEYDGMLYNYHYPKPDDIVNEQEEYIQEFIYDFESIMVSDNYNNPETGYMNITDINSFVDLIVMQEMSKNVDAYRLSTYIYKNIDSVNGKLTAGPIWDINHGYGNCDYGETWLTDGWLIEYNPEGGDQMTFWWEKIWEDEYFQSQITYRWNSLRTNILTNSNIVYIIDSLVIELGDAVEDNFDRWPILGEYVWPNYYVFDTYEEEVEYLKSWTIERFEWMDGQLESPLGDINQDGLINILDIIHTINIILDLEVYNDLADMNLDGVINVLDVVQIVNIILNP